MPVPIYPKLDGATAERFPRFMRRLQAVQSAADRQLLGDLLLQETEWCNAHGHLGDQRLVYEVCIRVLADLVRTRWRVIEQGYGFALQNPRDVSRSGRTTDLIAGKAAIREELRPVVDEQLSAPLVQRFRQRLEVEGGGKRPVTLLSVNSHELECRLEPAFRVGGEARVAALRTAVRPYLQRATDAEDPVTGHSLRDIWRYFRYTWSIPQLPVPGRQLLYLIRDAAHVSHPVIGITALNNCPLEMGETRESYIGWHFRAMYSRFEAAVDHGRKALEVEFAWLENQVGTSLNEVDWTHLVSPDEVVSPTPDVVKRLHGRYQEFSRLREEILRAIAQKSPLIDNRPSFGETPPVDDAFLLMEAKASVDPRMHAARKWLVAKKRAYALRRLLEARLTLKSFQSQLTSPATALATLSNKRVVSAVNIILEAIKGRRAGANMLEITTCGAIGAYAPYLGGKLAALLMLSPEVADDYRALYSTPSIISSQIRNRPVVRDCTLAMLGTTSLYVHGSSQYNRLRLPPGTIAPDQPELRYWKVGKTSGFGTVQFSPDTSRAIDQLLASRGASREMNSVFGEGTSPKMRKLKLGLRAIGLDADNLLLHRQHRLIYATPLWNTAHDWLLERTDSRPSYASMPSSFRDGTEKIAEYWRRRWLASRLETRSLSRSSAQCDCEGGQQPRVLPIGG